MGIPGVELCKPLFFGVDPGEGAPARIPPCKNQPSPIPSRRLRVKNSILMARATGFQIYVCRPGADGKPAWTLKAPDAELFDEQGKSIGKHFGGPTWQLNDGSQITGKMAAKADAPDPKAIPWLLVTVTGHSGSGKLSGVTSIQRVNTVGGLAPAAAGMHSAERGSGVQEQLFRGLLLLRAAVTQTLPTDNTDNTDLHGSKKSQ